MEHVKKVARTINFNYLLYPVAAVALFYAFTTPLIVDPVIAFLFAGIIPGTDVVLSPEIVLIILTDIFGLAISAALVTWLIRRRLLDDVDYTEAAELADRPPRSRHLTKHAVLEDVAPAAPSHTPVTKTARAADKPVLQLCISLVSAIGWTLIAIGLTIVSWLLTAATVIARYAIFILGMVIIIMRFTLCAMLAGALQIGSLLLRGLKVSVTYGTWATVFLIVLLGTLIDWSIRFGRYSWRQSRPYLRRFDTWLEIMVRRTGTNMNKRMRRSERLQIVTIIVKDSAHSLRRLFSK